MLVLSTINVNLLGVTKLTSSRYNKIAVFCLFVIENI